MADQIASNTAGFPICAKDFNSHKAKTMNQLIDYYEGCQLKHVQAMLDGKAHGSFGARKNWRERGMVPRNRNITKSIVDKSGLLMNAPPKLTVQTASNVEGQDEPLLNAILE